MSRVNANHGLIPMSLQRLTVTANTSQIKINDAAIINITLEMTPSNPDIIITALTSAEAINAT